MIERGQYEEQTPPDFRLISNPFDPPSSVHLRQRLASFSIFNDDPFHSSRANNQILSIERRAQIQPQRFSEHILQIDTSLFNEELRQRYQRASDHFCQTHLDLPTPIPSNDGRRKNPSRSSSSSDSSFDRTRTTRHMACQTRLSLPPAADLDSLIQSFASTSDAEDPPIVTSTSLNGSQIRRKLFSEDEDLSDEISLLQQPIPRRSSIFDTFQVDQRSSSPSQHLPLNSENLRQEKPLTPDCSPISFKQSIDRTPEPENPCPRQLPSDYARQVLDQALAELLECSM